MQNKRLTKRFMYGLGHKDCYDACFVCDVAGCCGLLKDILEKLAHYEDLEEQGRLVELPCAVGDTVWLIEKNYNKCANHYDCEHYDYDEYLIIWCEKNCPNGFRGTGVIQAIIEAIEINREQVLVQLNVHDNYLRVPITSVFLTKEEAEAKLAKSNIKSS